MKSTKFDGFKFDKLIDSRTFNTCPYTQITLYFAKMGKQYVVISVWSQFIQYCSEHSQVHLLAITNDYEEAEKVYSKRVARLKRKYERRVKICFTH